MKNQKNQEIIKEVEKINKNLEDIKTYAMLILIALVFLLLSIV